MPQYFDSGIGVKTDTRALVKAQKRGQDSYDDLFRKMVAQYEPDEAPEKPLPIEGGEGDRTKLLVSKETQELVKSQKRGGESYDTLSRKMLLQYDPDEAHENPLAEGYGMGKA